MRTWLARFSFSFIIIAAVLVWEGSRQQDSVKQTLSYLGAAVCTVLGIAGIRARHGRGN